MAFCINCGAEISEGAKFCSGCGKAVEDINLAPKRKTVYDGELHKCPNCGEILNSFVLNCPTCNYEIRNAAKKSSVYELAMKLECIDKEFAPQKEMHTLKNSVINLFQLNSELEKANAYRINLIRSFVIPTTKEDILEFIILATANIDTSLYGEFSSSNTGDLRKAVSDAWLAKLEQAYQKAQFSIFNSPEFVEIQKIYSDKKKQLHKAEKKRKRAIIGYIILMSILVIIPVVGLIFLYSYIK